MNSNRLRVRGFFLPGDWWLGVMPQGRQIVHLCNHYGPRQCAQATVRSVVIGLLPMVQLKVVWRGRWRPAPPKLVIEMSGIDPESLPTVAEMLTKGSFVVAGQPVKKSQSEPGVN